VGVDHRGGFRGGLTGCRRRSVGPRGVPVVVASAAGQQGGAGDQCCEEACHVRTNGPASWSFVTGRDNPFIDPSYDTIGVGYTRVRRADPRIAARIRAALGDARTVLNVGAGAGAYEPADLDVTAVEPSEVMRAQRPPGAAPVVDAVAEALPFPDGSFDAAMAALTDHHWSDRPRGLAEMRRVARRQVLFTWEGDTALDAWIVRDYFPGFARFSRPARSLDRMLERLGGGRIEVVPVPHDCADGFFHAYWRRPEAYLDETVRAGISVFARLDPKEVEEGVARLGADLESGEWRRRNAGLLELEELDLGYRLVVAGPARLR
jgi:SAM-dependent methyltransferase